MKNKWVKRTVFTTIGMLAIGATAMGIRIATIQPTLETKENIELVNNQNEAQAEPSKPTTTSKKRITRELEYLYIGLISCASFIFLILMLILVVQIKNRQIYLYFCNY